MLQQSLAVFLVLALLLAALWLLRRQGLAASGLFTAARTFGVKSTGRHLRLVERLVLTPQHSLHLISIGDRLIVFATSPTGCEPVEAVPSGSSTSLQSGASC